MLIALAGLVGIAIALQVSLAEAYASVRPGVALKAAPYNAAARSKLADQLVSSESDDAVPVARRLALDALRRDPIQPAAMRVLGLAAAERPGSEDEALALMLQSQRLSKRDLQTQLWLVDYFGRKNQPEAMIRHLDLALRSSESGRPGIFPLLDVAAADPRAREILIRTLAKRPNWAVPFAVFEVRYGADWDFAAEVARLLLDPADRTSYAILLQRLADQQQYELAWRVYNDPATGLVHGSSGAIRNGDFERPEDSSRFDWSYAEEPDLWASKERLAGHGLVLRVAANNGRAGDVARQIIHLAPGRYQLGARMGDIPVAAFERPEIRVECAPGSGSGELLSLRPDDAAKARQTVEGSFVVPTGCAFQRLGIYVAGERAQNSAVAWIDDIWIR